MLPPEARAAGRPLAHIIELPPTDMQIFKSHIAAGREYSFQVRAGFVWISWLTGYIRIRVIGRSITRTVRDIRLLAHRRTRKQLPLRDGNHNRW